MSATARQTTEPRAVDVLRKQMADTLRDSHALLLGVLVRDSGKGRALLELLGRLSGGWCSTWRAPRWPSSDLDRLACRRTAHARRKSPRSRSKARRPRIFTSRPLGFPVERCTFSAASPRTTHLRLSLTTLRDGKPVTQQWELAVDPKQDDVFVGRLWAQRKLDQLRSTQPVAQEPRRGIDTLAMSFGMGGGFQVQQPPSQNPPKPAEDPHKQQIIALSQEWSLLTPYTAFLVLENDREYPLWGIDRQQRHRYWKPADALPHTPPPASLGQPRGKPHWPHWSQESEAATIRTRGSHRPCGPRRRKSRPGRSPAGQHPRLAPGRPFIEIY